MGVLSSRRCATANRLTTWSAGNTLTATALNNEFSNVYIGTIDRSAGRWGNNDAIPVAFGSSQDCTLTWNTAQTNHALVLTVAGSNSIIVCEEADKATDFGIGNQTNPTLYIHSADATTVADYISLTHDQTDSIINSGAGSIIFALGGSTEATLSTSGLNLISGDAYSIAGTSVLNATTLGSAVVSSSLTSVGTLTALAVSAAPAVTVADAATNAPSTVIATTHSTSGSATTAFGSSISFTLEDASGNVNDPSYIDMVWATATHSSERSDVVFRLMTGGVAAAEKFRFSGGGTITCATALNLAVTTGAMTLTPASGSNLNVSLATTGDFAVNTSHLYVDTSQGSVNVNSAGALASPFNIKGSATAGFEPQLYLVQQNNDTGGWRFIAGTDGHLRIYSRQSSSDTERLTFLYDSARFGVNNASPRATLDILTSGTANTSGDTPRDLLVVGPTPSLTGSTASVFIQSNDAQAADKGGTLGFGGRSTDASTVGAYFAGIAGLKANGTTGNLDGYLAFYTRSNSGGHTEKMRIDPTGSVFIGDTTNAKATLGLTINQAGNDDEILALKSSDVAHGVTDIAETDTYGLLKKAQADAGGLIVRGFSETFAGLYFHAIETTNNTDKNTSATGGINLITSKKSGTGTAVVDANANLVVIADHNIAAGTTQFIFDAEGSGHANVEWTTFDSHDDLALVEALDYYAGPRANVDREFGKFLQYNKADLQAAKICNFEGMPEGRVMLNYVRLPQLLVGTVRQLGDTVKQLRERIGELETKLLPS